MINGLKKETCTQILERLKSVFELRPISESKFNNTIEWMRHDKKNDVAQINFTLLNKIGQADYNKTVSENVIEEAMYRYNSFLNESL